MKGKDALHSDAIRNLAHGECGTVAAPRETDDDSFKHLSPFFFSFDDLDVDADGFARPEGRKVFFGLCCFDLTYDIHGLLLFFRVVPRGDQAQWPQPNGLKDDYSPSDLGSPEERNLIVKL